MQAWGSSFVFLTQPLSHSLRFTIKAHAKKLCVLLARFILPIELLNFKQHICFVQPHVCPTQVNAALK